MLRTTIARLKQFIEGLPLIHDNQSSSKYTREWNPCDQRQKYKSLQQSKTCHIHFGRQSHGEVSHVVEIAWSAHKLKVQNAARFVQDS